MKRTFLIYSFVCSVLAVALFANAAGAGNILAAINNTINGQQEIVIVEQVLACWVSDDPGGAEVRAVKESGYGGEYMYWMTYVPGRTIYSLIFYVLFEGAGWGQSPLVMQMQKFEWPGGYGGGTTTPFGVPWWGGDPIIGRAYLIPVVDGVVEFGNVYAFEVVK